MMSAASAILIGETLIGDIVVVAGGVVHLAAPVSVMAWERKRASARAVHGVTTTR